MNKANKRKIIYGIRIERRLYEDDWEPAGPTAFDMDVPRYGKGFTERAYTTLDAANADLDRLLKKVEFSDPCNKSLRKIDKRVDEVVECAPTQSCHVRHVDVYARLGDGDGSETVIVMTLNIVKIELV